MSYTDQFNAAVQAKMDAAGLTHQRAVAAVVKADPELHRNYLREHNAAYNRGYAARSLAR